MEEYFWSEEPFVSDVHDKWLLSDIVDTFIFLNFRRIAIVFGEFFRYIWTYITMFLLD